VGAGPEDPFAAIPFRDRISLRRRLRRTWRESVAERRAESLQRLRGELHGALLRSSTYRGQLSELVFEDGVTVRLWTCHRPAIKALCAATRNGDVRLIRADHHGHCWALYFATLEGRLPVICRDLLVHDDFGGLRAATGSDVRSPQLV
jgi:hypothetical protein